MNKVIACVIALFVNCFLFAQEESANRLEFRIELMSINELTNDHYLRSNSINSARFNVKINTSQKYFFGLYSLLGTSNLDRDNFNSYVYSTFMGDGAKGAREEIMLTSYMNHSGFNFELGLPVGFTFDLSDKLYLETSAGFYVASWTSTVGSARHKNAIVEYSSSGSTEEDYVLNQLSSNGFGFFTGVDLCLKSTKKSRVNIGVGYSMLDKTWSIDHSLGPDFGNNEYKVLLDLLRVRLGVSILSESNDFF